MGYSVTLLPENRYLSVNHGERLLDVLRDAGIFMDAPCGGTGRCGKCLVMVNGEQKKACSVIIQEDLVVEIPQKSRLQVLKDFGSSTGAKTGDYRAAFDIGTTSVVCVLLGPDGSRCACEGAQNPQSVYGADVVSRIRYAADHGVERLTALIRDCMSGLLCRCCTEAGIMPEQVNLISVVGNSCMQQLFLGMPVDNLREIPYRKMLDQVQVWDTAAYLPVCPQGKLLIVPDISGFVGADTVGCVLASGMHQTDETVLLVDIGTNGEMVLCHRGRMASCATAAGPALEGANISCGMRASEGAIDHVDGEGFHVIGGTKAAGICGSGLVDAAAVMLRRGLLNSRGKLMTENGCFGLTDEVLLTQEDLRQVQLAKGAIHAGIELLMAELGVTPEEIDRCLLAGAFGSFLNPENACRIGLLPESLQGKIAAAGNLALEGAAILALQPEKLAQAQQIADKTAALELGSHGGFPRAFADGMRFREEKWLVAARKAGFQDAAMLQIEKLTPMEMVREACAADKCRAYGKNWTCPPHCGTLEQCAKQIRRYRKGILLQTVGNLDKSIDTRGYARTEQAHLAAFRHFCGEIRKEYPDALCLGSGGCRICGKCAWPEPCRFPDQACGSMEGYGLFVTQVCRDHNLKYYHGAKTITYSACVLFDLDNKSC